LPYSPIIVREGRNFTTGCPLRRVRQFYSVLVRLLKTATFFERMMRLKEDFRI
jgi:rRNA maturation protein Rpf1